MRGAVTIGGEGSPDGEVPRSKYEEVVDRWRGKDVQSWARDISKQSQTKWKDQSKESEQKGWTSRAGQDKGRELPSSTHFLDPRVRMVVIQYPSGARGAPEVGKGRNIEQRLRPVPYPDMKVKKSKFTSGWWNVYIELWTTNDGRIDRYRVLRPETDGPLERIFVDQVKSEMERWTFESGISEIHVDVRFYVE